MSHASAEWERTNGPYGGDVLAIPSHGSYIFVDTRYAGVYRSSDEGLTWRPANVGINARSRYTQSEDSLTMVSGFSSDGNDVYAAGNYSGLFRSTDFGASWFSVKGNLPDSAVQEVAATGGFIFAKVNNIGVFRSSDKGLTWEDINKSIDVKGYGWNTRQLIIDNGVVYVTKIGKGVLKSTDQGSSWEIATQTMWFSNCPAIRGSRFVADSSRYIHESHDAGKTKEILPTMLNYQTQCIAFTENTLFIGSERGVSISYDRGVTWTYVILAPGYSAVRTIVVIGNHVWAGMEYDGM